MLADWFEVYHNLHEGQMSSQKQYSMSETVASVTLPEAWAVQKLADLLLINIKGALSYVSLNVLLLMMDVIMANENLVW